jgi:hypothetical protein
MSAAREPDQADFDLERFINMFDEALTSQDPRVINSLRDLMMMVTLTRPEVRSEHSQRYGPLRRLFEDMNHLNRRMHDMDEKINDIRMREAQMDARTEKYRYEQYPNEKYTLAAAKAMAAQVDQDMLNQLKRSASIKAKGLLK